MIWSNSEEQARLDAIQMILDEDVKSVCIHKSKKDGKWCVTYKTFDEEVYDEDFDEEED